MFLTRIFSAEVKLKPYTFKKNQFSDNKNKSKEIIRFWCIFISWLRTWINWIKKPITGKIAQHGDTEFSDERMNFLGQHLPIILHWQDKTLNFVFLIKEKLWIWNGRSFFYYENMKFEDESSSEQRLRMALSLNTQT